MPLGKQFKNTYFVNEQGETIFHTPNEGETNSEVRPMPHIGSPYIGSSYQGMLFDPHWGTGSSKDPSISDDERHAAIDRVLGTGDVEAFRRVNGPLKPTNIFRHKTSGEEVTPDQMTPEDRANTSKNYRQLSERAPRVSVDRATMQIEGVRKAAIESGIPHQEWANLKPVGVEVRPPQRTWGGHYDTSSGNITLNELTKSEWVAPKEKPALPPAKRGAPIPNPKWRAQTEALGEEHGYGHNRLFTEGFSGWMEDSGSWYSSRNDPENMPRTPQQAVAPTYFNAKGEPYSPDKDTDVHYLPGGHTANIFPGKGASTKDYIATPIKTAVENEYSGRNKTLWYHLRHEAVPDPTAEVAEPKQPKSKRVIVSSGVKPDTLTHELGHSIDPNIRDMTMSYPDPIQEGAADGYEDRHHKYRDAYEEALDPSRPSRAKELQSEGGYGANYFKTRTGGRVASAAYIAARAHVAMGENNMNTIPNRKDLWNGQTDGMYADDAAKKRMTVLALGHLYHHHEHVRQALASTGYEAEGKAAHKAWAAALTDGARDTQPPTQPTLF